MTISPIQPQTRSDASNIAVENLAGDKHLTEQQKIAEASRQFEAIMLRQILSESQKPVITSEFTDNSTAAGIYQDYVTNTLADSMSKSGTLGLAKVFEQQLTHPATKTGAATTKAAALSAFQKNTASGGSRTAATAHHLGEKMKPIGNVFGGEGAATTSTVTHKKPLHFQSLHP